MNTTLDNSQQTINIWSLKLQSNLLSDEEFETVQIKWLYKVIAHELSWQIIEILIEQIRNGIAGDKLIIKIRKISDKFGFNVNESITKHIGSNYCDYENIWREPKLFDITEENFEKVHNGIKKLEQMFKLKTSNINLCFGLPTSRAQYRRANISKQSGNALDCIKDRFEIRFSKEGAKKFKQFVQKKIIADKNLYKFLFRGKDKDRDEDEQQRDGYDAYEIYRSVRNTTKRRDLRKFQKSAIFQVAYAKWAKMRGVIMPPTSNI